MAAGTVRTGYGVLRTCGIDELTENRQLICPTPLTVEPESIAIDPEFWSGDPEQAEWLRKCIVTVAGAHLTDDPVDPHVDLHPFTFALVPAANAGADTANVAPTNPSTAIFAIALLFMLKPL